MKKVNFKDFIEEAARDALEDVLKRDFDDTLSADDLASDVMEELSGTIKALEALDIDNLKDLIDDSYFPSGDFYERDIESDENILDYAVSVTKEPVSRLEDHYIIYISDCLYSEAGIQAENWWNGEREDRLEKYSSSPYESNERIFKVMRKGDLSINFVYIGPSLDRAVEMARRYSVSGADIQIYYKDLDDDNLHSAKELNSKFGPAGEYIPRGLWA